MANDQSKPTAKTENAESAPKAKPAKTGAPQKGTKETPAPKAAAAKSEVKKEASKPAAKVAAKVTPKPKPKPAPKAPPSEQVYAPARAARMQNRHWLLVVSFVVMVLLPAAISAYYMWGRAVDQYTSDVGFTVRREEAPSTADLLGGLSGLSQGSSSDSDILYEFIQSQQLVTRIDEKLDLRSLYSRHYDADPLFSLNPDSPIEDLVDYWQRMVRVAYAPGTGLIELEVLAFTPEEARQIAMEIFAESTLMINKLSDIAREDTLRYAREDLENTVEQLKQARQALTAFRSRTQIVDPSADIQLQMGLLTTLQQQLGEELITYDLLRESARTGDPRISQSEKRIKAIRDRIRQERDKFGSGGENLEGPGYASLVADFERLSVDREFAEQKYIAALSNFDIAQAEAQRQSRYLAAYLRPTLAQSAEYPRRTLIFGLSCLFLVVAWATFVLIAYSLRDRR